MQQASFHLSLPCHSISATRDFYVGKLGASPGRNTMQWLDVDLYGNQITFTKCGPFDFQFRSYKFEEEILPSFHFGVLVSENQWEALLERIRGLAIEPAVNTSFLLDKPGAHRSFFVQDPNGYMVEFKNFIRPDEVFSL